MTRKQNDKRETDREDDDGVEMPDDSNLMQSLCLVSL